MSTASKEPPTTTAHSYGKGDPVRLVPTQGGYQKERRGTVVSVSAKQVVVQPEDRIATVRFRLEDGMPIGKMDQMFPLYVVRPAG